MRSVTKSLRNLLFALVIFVVLAPGLFTVWQVYRASENDLELMFNPVFAPTWRLASKQECAMDQPESKYCVWNLGFYLKRYPAFDQLTAVCEGRDVLVSGVYNKVREIEYRDITMFVYFRGQFMKWFQREAVFTNPDPVTRPTGIFHWGPWRLPGACSAEYDSWGAVLRHLTGEDRSLYTSVGPFPLPKPNAADEMVPVQP